MEQKQKALLALGLIIFGSVSIIVILMVVTLTLTPVVPSGMHSHMWIWPVK